MPSVDQMLQAGIAAARAGDLNQARSLLAAVVQADPASEQGWLWLGQCLATPDQRQYCFRRVLALNPHNVEAQRALGQTSARPETPTPVTPPSPPTNPVTSPRPLGAAPKVNPPPPTSSVRVNSSTPSSKVGTPAFSESSPQPLSRRLIIAAIALGSVLILTICGLGFVYLATRRQPAQVGGVIQGTATLPAATTTPTLSVPSETPLIATPTSTLAPDVDSSSATLPPWPTASLEEIATAQAGMSESQSLLQTGDTDGALARLDQVVADAPNYSLAYYTRAYTLYLITESQSLDQANRQQIYQALADASEAIRLDPEIGDFYLMRFKIYQELALTEPYRVDQDYWYTLALDDIRSANQLGNSEQYSERQPALVLAALGRCQESLEEVNQLIAALGPDASPSGGLNYVLALDYLCLSEPSEALKHIDVALQVNSSSDYQLERVMILYSLGRLDEALDQFRQNVSDYPDACECRFYVGALVDYAVGEPDQAQVDIETAQDALLSGRGVRAYVLGRLALDKGDKQQAIKRFQEAEAQLTRDYGPTLLSQIKQQLSELGASPLSPTQSVFLTTTPQP